MITWNEREKGGGTEKGSRERGERHVPFVSKGTDRKDAELCITQGNSCYQLAVVAMAPCRNVI